MKFVENIMGKGGKSFNFGLGLGPYVWKCLG